jgi:hypothetical protein
MANATLDEKWLTKYGFLTGVGMILAGVLGHTVVAAVAGPLPAWEQTLFTDLEALGILTALLSVFVFGVIVPLTR